MELFFENKNVGIYKELCYQRKIIQESVESVVPDTDDDIGRIATVQSCVLLKSKDISTRGVLVTGEALATLIYINEAKDKHAFVKLSKSFSIEYDIANITDDALAQIKLSVLNAEARIINPRKVSVSFEIAGDLSCYASEEMSVESGFNPQNCAGLHVKYDSVNVNTITAVCEKTFSLNEQFVFPSGKPRPERIISSNVDYTVNDAQFVGTKAIIKGNASIEVYYLSEDVNYPVKAEFNTSFSQIIDLGEEEMEQGSASVTLTGAYYELADSIGGDKLLDIELHAVLQMLCRSKREVVYISDAYSNLMPLTCERETANIKMLADFKKLKLSCDERLDMTDDCADALSIFVFSNRLVFEKNKVKANLAVDVVYRSKSGALCSSRRNIEMEADCNFAEYRIAEANLADVYIRPDGQYIDGHFCLEVSCEIYSTTVIDRISAVILDEELPIDTSELPALSLVRCTGESLWELAKEYHSTVEKICTLNDTEQDIKGRMLLIPKSI